MKICFIGNAKSSHIVKWCTWFSEHGHEVHLISFERDKIENTKLHWINVGADSSSKEKEKPKYFLYAPTIRKIVKKIKPDIVNVHYASGYGITTALSGIRGYVLSVWGSDIYEFPNRSVVHKMLLKYSLSRAEYLFSTSKAMAEETGKYTAKPFEITPFGVDTKLFHPKKKTRDNSADGKFVVGIVKTLSDNYGIHYLLKAVEIVRSKRPDIPIELRIAGKGPREQAYKHLAERLGIADRVVWLGFLDQEQVASVWADMDCGVIPSEHESFGVSAIEAQACGVPLIVTDIPGLMEATSPGNSSIVVPRKKAKPIAEAIIRLYDDAKLRKTMGEAGRKYIMETYEIDRCFYKVERLFRQYTE